MSSNNISSYLRQEALPYLFCPGCGHGRIVDELNAALVKLQPDPHKVVIVTDIGCSGLSDRYFDTNAFHGLHGRSVTYATGIKLANPDLKVIVLMGDGGCGIGGHHLVNAARRNIGISVIIFNNLNYGMTGGEHSVTTPPDGITSTTPYGQLERPLDICQTAAVNGASFAARTTAYDKTLADLIARAIQIDGFSLVDIWELCTAYYVPNNHFSKAALDETMQSLGFPTGIIHQETRPEFSQAYRQATVSEATKPVKKADVIETKYTSQLDRETRCIIAGAAGSKVQSAVSAFCHGAVLSGLWASQRNDYPVTVRAGHSTCEVILSPEKIHFTGISKPDLSIILFKEGLENVRSKVTGMDKSGVLYIHQGLLPIQTQAQIVPLSYQWQRKKEAWAIMSLARLICDQQLYPIEAFKEAVSINPRFAQENRAAVEAALKVTSS